MLVVISAVRDLVIIDFRYADSFGDVAKKPFRKSGAAD